MNTRRSLALILFVTLLFQEIAPFSLAFADETQKKPLAASIEMPTGFVPETAKSREEQAVHIINQKNNAQDLVEKIKPKNEELPDWTLTLPDGTVQYYEQGHLVKQISADKATTLDFSYKADGTLKTITETKPASVTVYDFDSRKAVKTYANGEKKVYRLTQGLVNEGSSSQVLLSWTETNQGKIGQSMKVTGFLEEHTLTDGSVLTYNSQGQLIVFAANDERKTTLKFDYGTDGNLSKIKITYGKPANNPQQFDSIEFDFVTKIATAKKRDKTETYRFTLESRNSLMGMPETYDPNDHSVGLGGWIVPVENGLKGREYILYGLKGVLIVDIPQSIQDYAKNLQDSLGSGYTVSIVKGDLLDYPNGFVVRVTKNRLGALVIPGTFQEMTIAFKYPVDYFLKNRPFPINREPIPFITSVSYAGFEKVDVSLLQAGLEQIVQIRTKGLDQLVNSLTLLMLTEAKANEIRFRLDGNLWRVYRDSVGSEVKVEKIPQLPPAIEAYAKELQNQLGGSYQVKVVISPDDPNKFILTIDSVRLGIAVRPGQLQHLSVALTYEKGGVMAPYGLVMVHEVKATYAGFEKVDGTLLFLGLHQISQDDFGTLTLMAQITLTDSGSIYSIRFKYNREDYEISKKNDGTIVVVKQLFDPQGRIIKESSLDGKNATYYAYGADYKVVIKFGNGMFVSAEKTFDNGTVETYDHLREIAFGDAQPLPGTDPAIGPDEVILWSLGGPHSFNITVVVGTLKSIRFPNGVELDREALIAVAGALKVTLKDIQVLDILSSPFIPRTNHDPSTFYLQVLLPNGDKYIVAVQTYPHLLLPQAVYTVVTSIKTELGIKTVLNIVKALGVRIFDLKSTYVETLYSVPINSFAPAPPANAIRLGVSVVLTNGKEYALILEGVTEGLTHITEGSKDTFDVGTLDVITAIETNLGIQTLVHIAQALHVDITNLSTLTYEFIKLIPVDHFSDPGRISVISAMIALKDGKKFEGILEGSALGLDGNNKVIFSVTEINELKPAAKTDAQKEAVDKTEKFLEGRISEPLSNLRLKDGSHFAALMTGSASSIDGKGKLILRENSIKRFPAQRLRLKFLDKIQNTTPESMLSKAAKS